MCLNKFLGIANSSGEHLQASRLQAQALYHPALTILAAEDKTPKVQSQQYPHSILLSDSHKSLNGGFAWLECDYTTFTSHHAPLFEHIENVNVYDSTYVHPE